MAILGIETSCDETALALIEGRTILREALYSQITEHQEYGGVVPNIAAHAHNIHLPTMAAQMLKGYPLDQIEGIAVTAGPGLIGGLLVGLMFAKGLALSLKKPLWGVNHLAAHALMPRMWDDSLVFPYLLLLLSGGHSQLVLVKSPQDFQVLGGTLDDAVGECLDKVARCLGLEYPGGPAVELLARTGDPFAIPLPTPLQKEKNLNFSFSGLKTACLNWIQSQPAPLSEIQKANLCASLQRVIADHLCTRLKLAISSISAKVQHVVVSGGVAANRYFFQRLKEAAAPLAFSSPPLKYCTDNAVMVAWCGHEYRDASIPAELHVPARARWPLG